ncbi:MAG: sporulation integral membrane protein YtvI [Lachnospiraceae bacterium]|nr:sporulation integral membrane protein YtvI [Lachnospiraceae bacterium]
MKRYCKALVNLAISLVIFLGILFLVPKLLVLFAPFVAGYIIAWIVSPMVRFFEEKVRLKRKAGSAFVIILFIGLVVLLIYLVGAKLVDEVIGFVNELPLLWTNLEKEIQDIVRNYNDIYKLLPQNIREGIANLSDQIGVYMSEFLGNISSPAWDAVSNFAKSLPAVIIGVIMALLSSYLFVLERNNISAWFYQRMPGILVDRYNIVSRSVKKAVGGYLKAQLKIEVWMYLLLLVGLSILQVEYAFLIALGIAFLDILPFFGTGTVMVPWAIIKILSGNYTMAIGLLIMWGVGQLVRQLIQPKFVGDSIGVEPIPTLILLYLGFRLGGVLGMIIAVPIGLIIFTMYEEGVFDTTKNSILILVAGINHFRKIESVDMVQVEQMLEKEQKERKDAEY